MKILQLTSLNALLSVWEPLDTAFAVYNEKARVNWTSTEAFLACLKMITQERNAFCAVIVNEENKQVQSFLLAELVAGRCANIVAFYYADGGPSYGQLLQTEFEQWCHAERVETYYLMTPRMSGCNERNMRVRFGLKPAGTVFSKTLTH